jgi:hypothetical protein
MSARCRRPEEPVDRDELLRLADDLQAALAAADLRQAVEAHEELGKQLERVTAHDTVVDLARERAKRGGGR